MRFLMKFIRKIGTPTTIFCSLIVFGTGLWMFFFSKSQLIESIHGKIGILFFLAAILHVIINQGSFLRLLKSKGTYLAAITAISIGALWIFYPKQEEKGIPTGLILRKLESAQLNDLSKVFNKDVTLVISEMKRDGLVVIDENGVLSEVAKSNGKTSKDFFKYFMLK